MLARTNQGLTLINRVVGKPVYGRDIDDPLAQCIERHRAQVDVDQRLLLIAIGLRVELGGQSPAVVAAQFGQLDSLDGRSVSDVDGFLG